MEGVLGVRAESRFGVTATKGQVRGDGVRPPPQHAELTAHLAHAGQIRHG